MRHLISVTPTRPQRLDWSGRYIRVEWVDGELDLKVFRGDTFRRIIAGDEMEVEFRQLVFSTPGSVTVSAIVVTSERPIRNNGNADRWPTVSSGFSGNLDDGEEITMQGNYNFQQRKLAIVTNTHASGTLYVFSDSPDSSGGITVPLPAGSPPLALPTDEDITIQNPTGSGVNNVTYNFGAIHFKRLFPYP